MSFTPGPNTSSRLELALLSIVLACLAVLAYQSPGGVSAQPPTQRLERDQQIKDSDGQRIRVATQLVNVLFSVTDKKNRYISDLTENDVTVLENGKPQEIFTFKREFDLPLTMAILVDVSHSVLPVLPRLTGAGTHFIKSVIRPGKDTAAVIEFDGEARVIQELTTSIARLHFGLEEIARAAPPRRGTAPPIQIGSRMGGTSIYDSVVATCEDLLAGEAGRKTIVLFTDGYDTTSHLKYSDAIDHALRANAIIYAIGIGDARDEGVDKKALNKLCEPTGGRAFFPKGADDLNRAFAQLEQELRQQYLLAYEPLNETADGKFRKIEVRVNNRKDVRIHHRQGYYAPKASPADGSLTSPPPER